MGENKWVVLCLCMILPRRVVGSGYTGHQGRGVFCRCPDEFVLALLCLLLPVTIVHMMADSCRTMT